MANAATYTTYLRTELDPVTRQTYTGLRAIASETYQAIARDAGLASDVAAAAFNNPKNAAGLRQLQGAANGTFTSIRREATEAGNAISTMQTRLAGLRATALQTPLGVSGGGSASAARNGVVANDNLVASNRRVAASATATDVALRRQAGGTATLRDNASRLSRSLDVLGTTISVVQGPLGPVAGRVSAVTAAINQLGPATLVLAGAATALFAFAGVANVYAEAESKLRPLYESQTQVNQAMRETGRIALLTRSSLSGTIDLYSKLTRSAADFGISQQRVSRVTELASKAATLSGGAAVSREAGLYQFGQAIGKGRLNDDEFKSLGENIPELLRAIAAGYKNLDGSIGTAYGNLAKLSKDGKLTTEAVVGAIERSGERLDAQFAKLPRTISSARTEFVTTFTLLVGQTDQMIGVTTTLAETLGLVTANLRSIISLGGAFAAAFAFRFIAPKLGAFLAELRAAIALRRELNAQSSAAFATGAATRLTPAGIEFAKANTAAVEASAAVIAAKQRVAASREVSAAIGAEAAASRVAAEADREKARSGAATTAFAKAQAAQRVEALEAELAAILETKAAAQTRYQSSQTAGALIARNPNLDDNRRGVLTAQNDAYAVKSRTELAQADLRAAGAARALATAQADLAIKTEAASAAALANADATNAANVSGFRRLSLIQAQILADQAVAAAELEVAAAETVLTGATGRLTLAQRALAASQTVVAATMRGVGSVASGLIGLLGGPLNAAILLVGGALFYLASRSDAARDSLADFSGSQEQLFARLGFVTGKVNEQASAFNNLALAAATARLEAARTTRTEASNSLGRSLTTVAARLNSNVRNPQDQRLGQQVSQISQDLSAGRVLTPKGARDLANLQVRRPDLFRNSGIAGSLNNLLGRNPAEIFGDIDGKQGGKVGGVEASIFAEREAAATVARLRNPKALPTPSGATSPLTPQQIRDRGIAAARDYQANPAKQAKLEFDDKVAKIQANDKFSEAEKIAEIRDATIAYNNQTAAIDKRNASASRTAANKAEAARNKLLREQEEAANAAARATETLADIRARADDSPRLVDQVRNDQRALEALVGEQINVKGADGKTTRRTYTRADATADAAAQQERLLRPVQDITREYDRQAETLQLQIEGRDAEAEALGRAYQLIDRTGVLTKEQYADLVRQAERQEALNRTLEDRQRVTSILRGSVDEVKRSTEQFLTELPNNATAAAKNLGRNLLAGFQSSSAKLLNESLFGGVQKRIDDLISGKTALQSATEFTAQQTVKVGTSLGDVSRGASELARVLNESAGLIGQGDTRQSPAVRDFLSASPEMLGDVSTSSLSDDIGDAAGEAVARALGTTYEAPQREITVVAKRLLSQPAQQPQTQERGKAPRPPTLREIYNETGRSIGEKIDTALGTKFAAKLGGKLGDALQGAGQGSFASSIASAIGLKQSKTGAAIGGAIGSALPIPGGAFIGGLVGGTIGGLFKKTAKGGVSITGADTSSYSGSGKLSESLKGNASSVQDSISSIAEQLGVTTGAFGVAIGKYGDYYHVSGDPGADVSAKHPKSQLIYEGKDEAAAIQAAILNALQDGAIKGISEASQRILASGQDLQGALKKALLIESVPKRLLALTNPVRAAVEDLNKEFEQIISALNEGRGTAEQYAQAQQLYDLERARAIEEASKAATSAIDQYLKDMVGGSSSPLNKLTTYQNAQGDLDKLRSQVEAGKAVSSDDLLSAARNFQDASRTLNGSSSSFFSDFESLRALLERAKTNQGGGSTGGDLTNLPASPFSTDSGALAALGQSNVQATQDQTAALSAKLDQVTRAVSDLGEGPNSRYGSAIDLLPGFGNNLALA